MRRSLLLAALLLFPSLALAEAPPAISPGEALFREGRAALLTNDLITACARFEASQKLEPAPGTLLNLGDCEERQGHLVAARAAFQRAAAGFMNEQKGKYAQERAEALDGRIPRLTLVTEGALPAGAEARIGDRTVTLGTPISLDPGKVTVQVTAPGSRTRTYEAELAAGERLVLRLEPPEPQTPRPSSTSGALRAAGFMATGAGAAGLLVGAIAGALTLEKASTVKSSCTSTLACNAEGLDAARSGGTLSTISTISFVAGGILTAAGILMIVTSPDGSKTALVPAASPQGATLSLWRTF